MDTRLLHAALFTPGLNHAWGLPLIAIGDPGTAKSALIVKGAVEAGLHVEVLIASLRDPTDFLGLMVAGANVSTLASAADVTGQGEGVSYIPPSWATRAAAAGRAVVFLDEINTAPPAVQAALLRVVLDRVAGDFALPPTVRFIAARNEVDDAAGGYLMAPALENRFGHIRWHGPTFDQWRAHILASGNGDKPQQILDPADEERRVHDAWEPQYASAAALVTSFLASHQTLWQNKAAAGPARPSMRTWEMAIRALASAKVHGLDEEETDTFVGSFVGGQPIVELRAFQANLDLPDSADLLDGKVSFVADPDRLDRTMVVLASCAALVAPTSAPNRMPRAAACWKLIAANMANPDICHVPATTLAMAKGGLARNNADATKVLARFAPIMKAAGIL